MATLLESATELDAAWRLLSARWQQTRDLWLDQKADEFEQQYETPLDQVTHATITHMQRMAELIAQAQRDVK